MSNPTTTVAIRSLPPGLARAIKHCAPKGRDVKIESRAEAVPSSYSSDARNNVNALVPKHLLDWQRADVCQDIMLAVLEGQTSIEALERDQREVERFIRTHRRKQTPYQERGLSF